MKHTLLFLLLLLFIFSCRESNHSQFTNIQTDSSANTTSQNLNFLLTKTYDELINEGSEIFVNEKNLVKAFPYFQTAWVKDSNRIDANYWLGCLHSHGSNAHSSYDYNALLKSLNYFNKVISINRNYRKALRERGVVKFKLHDIEGALNDFNEAIAIDANDTSLFLYKYSVEFILKDKKEACEDLLKAKNLGSIYAINKYETTCALLQ